MRRVLRRRPRARRGEVQSRSRPRTRARRRSSPPPSRRRTCRRLARRREVTALPLRRPRRRTAPRRLRSTAARGAGGAGLRGSRCRASAPRRYSTAAARAADDTLRRPYERSAAGREHAGLAQNSAAGCVDVDVELVPRGAIEGAAPVCPDLRPNGEIAQERERSPSGGRAREIDVDRQLAVPAQMPGTGGMGERRELARRQQRRRGGDPASSSRQLLRERHAPATAVAACTPRRASRSRRFRRQQTTRWHGTNGARPFRAQNVPGRAGGARSPGERGELAVSDDLAARDRPQRSLTFAVEAVVEGKLDVGEVVVGTREEGRQPPRQDVP